MSEPRYGVQSMVDPLRRVLIRRPATTGDFAAADWRQPDPARLIAEHEAFGALLESLGCEVTVAEPVEGMVDSVYVCDPVWTCGQGAIVLRSAKPARVGEGEAMVAPRLAEVPVRLPLPRPSGGHYGSIYEVQESLPARYFS